VKPNLAFLRKVADGKVKATFRYSARTGGRYGFVGGEKTARAHEEAGFIWVPAASFGIPGVARLTDDRGERNGRLGLRHEEPGQPVVEVAVVFLVLRLVEQGFADLLRCAKRTERIGETLVAGVAARTGSGPVLCRSDQFPRFSSPE
jgi:hypothetical protein